MNKAKSITITELKTDVEYFVDVEYLWLTEDKIEIKGTNDSGIFKHVVIKLSKNHSVTISFETEKSND